MMLRRHIRDESAAVRRWRLVPPMLLLAVAVTACSGSTAEPVASTEPTPGADTSVEPSPPVEPTDRVTEDRIARDDVAGDEPSSDDEVDSGHDLAGTSVDFFFREGDTLAVVGVAHDDALNVRSGPGVDAGIVSTLPPLADDVVATGSTRQLPASFWTQVDTGDAVGWANARYFAYLGQTSDVTQEVVAAIDRPTEADLLSLGEAVARTRASSEPASDIVVVAPPTVGDLGEVTLDVIGLGDDAVMGLRLHVFGQPTDGGFGLRTVEETLLCGRGVSRDGRCI